MIAPGSLVEQWQEELDSKLSDISDDAAHRRISRAKDALAALARFRRDQLSPAQQFSADMLEYQLRNIIDEEPHQEYEFGKLVPKMIDALAFADITFSNASGMTLSKVITATGPPA